MPIQTLGVMLIRVPNIYLIGEVTFDSAKSEYSISNAIVDPILSHWKSDVDAGVFLNHRSAPLRSLSEPLTVPLSAVIFVAAPSADTLAAWQAFWQHLPV